MEFGLVMQVLKLSLEIFQGERRDRFRNKYTRIEKEWMDEMSKPEGFISDLTLDRLHFDATILARLIISESASR
jgi:hypothetical protein